MNNLVRRFLNIVRIDIHNPVGRIVDRIVGAGDRKISQNSGTDATWSRHGIKILLVEKRPTSNKNLASTQINLAASLKNCRHFGMCTHAVMSLVTANLRIMLHESINLEIVVSHAHNRAALDNDCTMMKAQLWIVVVSETITHGLFEIPMHFDSPVVCC